MQLIEYWAKVMLALGEIAEFHSFRLSYQRTENTATENSDCQVGLNRQSLLDRTKRCDFGTIAFLVDDQSLTSSEVSAEDNKISTGGF